MRKFSPYFSLIAILLVGTGMLAIPHVAQAGGLDTVFNWLAISTDFFYGLLGKLLWWLIVPATSWIVGLVGLMIDGVIALSADPTFYNSPAIDASWSILRDVANMTFIFVLIYNGIKVILNMGNLSLVKQVLGGVLLAAIFLNFSLFITRAVIDVSNITASWFVQGIYSVGGEDSVSGSVRAVLSLDALARSGVGGDASSIKNFTAQVFATGIAMTALNCVAIYVFFQVFFLLLGRLISFMFLMVTAPIGFVGSFLPQLKSYSEEWWSELNNQAILAPMFFLMLYITLYIVDQMNEVLFSDLGPAGTDAVTGSGFSVANYIMFAVVIAMLLKILEISKKHSGNIGKAAGGLIKSGIGIALGGVSAVGGVAGRQFIGRKAFNTTQDKETMAAMEKKAAKAGLGGMYGRIKLASVNKAASSSFDARATTIGGKALGAFGTKISGIPLDAGKVGKTEGGGFKAGTEAFAKKEKEWAEKNLGKGPDGEINRMAYANAMQGSLLNKMTSAGVGSVAYKSTYEDMEKGARDNLRKKSVEDAKKSTKDISNKIVDEQVAIYKMKNAMKKGNSDEINAALEEEKNRINKIAKDLEESARKKNPSAHTKHLMLEIDKNLKKAPEGSAAIKELEAEKENLQKKLDKEQENLTKTEREEADTQAQNIVKYKEHQATQLESIKKALAIDKKNVLEKKTQTESIITNITNERIGKRSEKIDPDTGKKIQVAEDGTLTAQLDKEKKKLKEAQAELDAVEGKPKKDASKPKEGGEGDEKK